MGHQSFIYRYLIPSKLCYLCLYWFIGCISPFVNLFYISVGLTVTQAGIISGVRLIAAALGLLFVGMLADYTKRYKAILLCLIFVTIVNYAVFPWIIYGTLKTGIESDSQRVPLSNDILSKNISSLKFLQGNQIPKLKALNATNSYIKISDSLQLKLFLITTAWASVIASSSISLNGFIDALVMQEVTKQGSTFGMQRVFGPIGYMIGSFLSGIFCDMYEPENPLISKYTAVFYVFLPVTIVFFVATYFHNNDSNKNSNQDNKKKESIVKTLIKLCKQFEIIVFLLTTLLIGNSYYVVNGYLLVFLEEMEANKTAMGLTVATSSLAEILIFPLSSKLQKLIGGLYPSLAAATFSYALRFMFYYFIKNPWFALPVQLLQAIGFGLFWSAVVENTEKIAPKEINQTLFNVVILMYYSLGGITGNIGGGAIYEYYGGRKLFLFCSIICCTWSILLLLYHINFVRTNQQYKNKSIIKQEETIFLSD